MDAGRPQGAEAAATLLFLFLLCVGVVLDFALGLYFIKRPPQFAAWSETLRQRALPGRQILILVLTLIAFYLACSFCYSILFPYTYEPESSTLVFQGLVFNLPALLMIGGLFMRHRDSGRDPASTSWRRAPAMLGLSVLLYAAAIPILWFYSLLYQFFLYRLGFDFSLQDVAEIFLMSAPPATRMMMYLTAIVIVPVFEEFLFRGVLLPWAVRRVGFWPAVIAVSVVFSAIHMHLPALLPLFLLSVFFCIAYARTRSLLVPIGMHACFNGVTVMMLSNMG